MKTRTFVTGLVTVTFFIYGLLGCQKNGDSEEISENGAGSKKGCITCVHYVKQVLGITGGTADALNWGTTYPILGYYLVDEPQNDDIIVITPRCTEWSDHPDFEKYGHVGFVKELLIDSNGDIILKVKGGNQSGKISECGCSMVSTLPLTIVKNRRQFVRFYRKDDPKYNCPDFPSVAADPTRIINLSGDLNFNTVIIGNSPSRTLTISNTGNSPLKINSVATPNGYTSNYSSGTISAGGSVNASITFSPQSTVSNYNNTISINSNATSGTSTISVTGNATNGSIPNPTINPPESNPTACGFGNQTGSGNCAGSTYLGGIIRTRVIDYDPSNNTITFNIEKCSGSFLAGGTAYIKEGGYCGSVVAQQNYNAGASVITLSVTPALAAGSYSYTAVLVSSSSEKFYSLSTNVQY